MSEYKVLTRFEYGENKMVVIADTKSACVMTQEEWYLMESKETTIGKHKK